MPSGEWPPQDPPPGTRTVTMRISPKSESWRERAACRHFDTALWFPARGEDQTLARQICCECPTRPECLTFGLADSTLSGLWGGYSEHERRHLRGLLRKHLPQLAQHLPDEPPPPHPAVPAEHLTRAERRRVIGDELAGREPRRGQAAAWARRFGVSEASVSLDLKAIRVRAGQLPAPEPEPARPTRTERRKVLAEEMAAGGRDRLPWPELEKYAERFGCHPQVVYKDMRAVRGQHGEEQVSKAS